MNPDEKPIPGGLRLRPRDAATLILLERRDAGIRVLMGRRHKRHAFMPGKLVFPGGRTDAADFRIAVAQGLHPREEVRLVGTGARASPARARAIALSAIRETYEEAGLLVGRKGPFASASPGWRAFAEHGVQPSLERLRLVARAVTPPGHVRRFDTRFLAAWRQDVAMALPGGGPSDELEDLAWLPLERAREAAVAAITRMVLDELAARLGHDPGLEPGFAAPFFRPRHGRIVRDIL